MISIWEYISALFVHFYFWFSIPSGLYDLYLVLHLCISFNIWWFISGNASRIICVFETKQSRAPLLAIGSFRQTRWKHFARFINFFFFCISMIFSSTIGWVRVRTKHKTTEVVTLDWSQPISRSSANGYFRSSIKGKWTFKHADCWGGKSNNWE